jgi:beta-glucanase (GH16 family)
MGCHPSSAHTTPKAAEDARVFVRGAHTFRLNWQEEFEHGVGKAELGDWTFLGNSARFVPANVRAEHGKLSLRLTRSADGKDGRAYSGAEYDRQDAQMFGRFVARMRPSAPPGVIASFFTAFYEFTPDWEVRETAEIDIEFVGSTRAVQVAIHFIDEQGKAQQESQAIALPFDASEQFHDWEIEWLPERVAFYVDGRELHRFTSPAELRELEHPQEVRANLWISDEPDWAGPFSDSSLPVQADYEWLRAYTLVE